MKWEVKLSVGSENKGYFLEDWGLTREDGVWSDYLGREEEQMD